MTTPTTTTSAASTKPETVLQSRTTPIDPPDVAAYLDGVRQREPERVVELTDDDLVDFGMAACEFSDGYINGSSPNPGDMLFSTMVGAGYPEDLADRMTADIRNAAIGTLCTSDMVEIAPSE